jgi:pimeloyl-ACP methyl ester carboxylesterase
MIKITKYVTAFAFFFLLASLFTKTVFAETLFFDDFESGNANNWAPSSSDWVVLPINESNRYGTVISAPSTTRESYAGDINWQNYIYEVDMLALEGDDKNLIFRVIDNDTKYGLHMRRDLAVLEIYDPKRGYFEEFNYEASFVNDTLYHLKIVVNRENIKVYSNNNLLFDYTDTGTNITHGKIGLRVTTGAAYPSSVWFDNILVRSLEEPIPTATPTLIPTPTPTPTPTPPIPVVFLPGLGCSINFEEMFIGSHNPSGWKITPGVNIYQNILNVFNYPNNPNFYVFFYDWRRPATESAEALINFIKNDVRPWNKVDLIGHSLGGLVARACVQTKENNCYANKLITVGSPHLGVVEAYPAVEAGEIWRTGVMKMAFELLIHYYQKPGETRRETLQRVAPIMNDLLPNFEYLYQNGSLIPWNTLSIQNPLFPLLSNLSELANIVKTFYGRSYPTLNSLTVKETNMLNKILGNWPDGEPIDRGSTSNEGDETILSLSAKIDYPNIENFSFNLDHGGIISDQSALEKIFDLIGKTLPEGRNDSLEEEENYLVFFVHSPVKISLTDLPEGSYASDELIIVPNPQEGNYTLNITNSSDGYYLLSVGQINGKQVLWHDYLREVKENEQLEFAINPENPQENPLVQSEDQLKNSLTVAINEFEKEIRESSIKAAHQKVLLNFLGKLRRGNQSSLSRLSNLSSLRNQLLVFERNKFLDRETALLLRDKASRMAGILETLAFQSPEKINKSKASASIKATEEIKGSIVISSLTKEGALVFLEAQEKLDKANGALGKGGYWQAWIYSQEAKDLFLEAPKIP